MVSKNGQERERKMIKTNVFPAFLTLGSARWKDRSTEKQCYLKRKQFSLLSNKHLKTISPKKSFKALKK